MDRFEAMEAFVTAVDNGSLSAASRAHNTPLPTISRRVSELEAHLNAQLLVRTSRKLLLPDAGEAFAAAANGGSHISRYVTTAASFPGGRSVYPSSILQV